MYIPQERSEKIVILCYDEKTEESYYTIGIFKDQVDSDYIRATCILQDGRDELQKIHKEDVYEDTPSNRDKIDDMLRLFYLSE